LDGNRAFVESVERQTFNPGREDVDSDRLRARLLYYFTRSYPDQPKRWSRSGLADLLCWPEATEADLIRVAKTLPSEVRFKSGSGSFSFTFQTVKDAGTIARRVFEYWRARTGRSEATKYTSSRKGRIVARLREGYPEETLTAAVDGILKSAWHIGDNPTGRTYTGIDLIFRSGEKVEEFAGLVGLNANPTKTPTGVTSAAAAAYKPATATAEENEPRATAADLRAVAAKLWKTESE
jgi:hypothetical protein